MESSISHHTATATLNPDRNIKREDIIRELRRQAAVLREQGASAAEFWMAEQYEMTADLLN
jgi:hypothetical protein